MSRTAIHPAFHDAPRESQAIFRAVMNAMARPGRIVAVEIGFEPPAPLAPAAAGILLVLADFETPIWLDEALAVNAAVVEFLRFHTGAKLVADPQMAVFALISDAERAPPLSTFAQGTPDYPDRSTTIILQITSLDSAGWTLTGPGIKDDAALSASPLPAEFVRQLQDNHARFPLGVDVIFAGQNQIAALPRSIQIVETR